MRLLPLALVVLALCLPASARAARSFDSCTGTIASLPATITTQGTWCLKENLATAITSGAAITVAANNVTIDCNDFKVGGLAAGPGSNTVGIKALNRLNATIRNCGLRGFFAGIYLDGDDTYGALIEGNRFDNNSFRGIEARGNAHVIRDNRIMDTGGVAGPQQIHAILLYGGQHVVADNVISTVVALDPAAVVFGIASFGSASEFSRNTLSGLLTSLDGTAYGMFLSDGTRSTVRENSLLNKPGVPGVGISAMLENFCAGNHVAGFSTPIAGCTDVGGNRAF